jgi:hypothetical protein
MIRYEQLTHKIEVLYAAYRLAERELREDMAILWHSKYRQLRKMRDNMSIKEASAVV